MKRLLLTLVAAGPLLTGCQAPNLFSRQASSDLRDGRTSSSAERSRSLFALNKPSVEELLQQGQVAFEKQDHAAAIPLYEQVLEQEPANVSAHHRLAIVHDLEGEYADAERHYRAALDASPMDANIIGDLGYSYLLQERLAEAEQYLTRARSLDPTLKNVVHHLGTLYARQGNWPKSQQMFAQILPPEQVQAEMLKWGMPAGSPGANASSVAAAEQTSSITPPEGASPETVELWERMEQARLQSEAQRAQQERQRNQLEAYQRQQAAAAGYPYDPEGERLREQMSHIDRSSLPDNSGTLVIGPARTQNPAGQMPVQANNGSWPQATSPGAADSIGPSAQQTWSNGSPVTPASQQSQFPSANGMPTVSPQATTSAPTTSAPTGEYQQAPVYRGLGNQGTNPQLAGRQSPVANPIQQVGSNAGVPGSVHQAYGVGPYANPDQAHYEMGQQAPGSVSATGVVPVNGVDLPASTMQPPPSTLGDVNAFDAASRSAAIMGLGVGGGPMFPIAAPMTPQVSPGAGSMINGGMYPEVERQLPTDRLMDFNQSFQYQPDGSMQSTAHEFRGAPNSIGQTMPSVLTQSQQAGTSGMPPSPWQSSAGTGASAVPVNPLAAYEQQRADHDAQVQQMQQTQGMTPSLYMVAPASATNPHIPVVTGSQLMMNSPAATSSASQTNPWPDRPASPARQTQYGASQFGISQQPPLTQAPTLSQQQPLGQSPLTQQGQAMQRQPAPIEPVGTSPYYPVTNQLAPSPWDSVPRIDPNAIQAQTTNGVVTPPPYSAQGVPAASQGAPGPQQPAASSFAPANQGPVIRPR